jgi:glycosyltransferase involved in cell wall biosynthesis
VQPVCVESEFSRGKSFGKILAYLAGQVAVVASDAVDHPAFFRHGESGMLASDVKSWADALELLLNDPERRESMAMAAHRDYETKLTTPAFARRLDGVLRRAAGKRTGG